MESGLFLYELNIKYKTARWMVGGCIKNKLFDTLL